MKINLFSLESLDTHVFESYHEKLDRFLSSYSDKNEKLARAKSSIAVEGFFSFFNAKKDIKTIDDSEILKVYELVASELNTVSKDRESFTLKTHFFGTAKTARDALAVMKNYILHLEHVTNHFKSILKCMDLHYDLIHDVLKANTVQEVEKIFVAASKVLAVHAPAAGHYTGYKKDNTYTANKNLTLITDKFESVGVYYQHYTNFNITTNITDEEPLEIENIGRLPADAIEWAFSKVFMNKQITTFEFSKSEYIEFLSLLSKLSAVCKTVNEDYNLTESGKVVYKTILRFNSVKNTKDTKFISGDSLESAFDEPVQDWHDGNVENLLDHLNGNRNNGFIGMFIDTLEQLKK